MLDKIIKNYLINLKENDIYIFAKNNNIILDEKEVKIIYKYITNDWYTLLHGDSNIIFNNLKNEVKIETYNKCIEIYNYYYKKYRNYL